MICLATAHPAKFGAAVRRAIGHEPELPESLAGLADKESRCEVIAAEVGAVKAFVEQHAL
jgi:threonine synthase